jgi:hypothetical protein
MLTHCYYWSLDLRRRKTTSGAKFTVFLLTLSQPPLREPPGKKNSCSILTLWRVFVSLASFTLGRVEKDRITDIRIEIALSRVAEGQAL